MKIKRLKKKYFFNSKTVKEANIRVLIIVILILTISFSLNPTPFLITEKNNCEKCNSNELSVIILKDNIFENDKTNSDKNLDLSIFFILFIELSPRFLTKTQIYTQEILMHSLGTLILTHSNNS